MRNVLLMSILHLIQFAIFQFYANPDAGDLNLFHGLEAALIEALPKETAEWQRPYGRITKSVHIEAKFIPFSAESVSKQEDFKLINKPLLHTYWIECNVS